MIEVVDLNKGADNESRGNKYAAKVEGAGKCSGERNSMWLPPDTLVRHARQRGFLRPAWNHNRVANRCQDGVSLLRSLGYQFNAGNKTREADRALRG